MRTKVVLLGDVHQSSFKKHDVGYIDGYMRGGDGRPVVVVVRKCDGMIDMVPTYLLKAEGFIREQDYV